MKRLKFLILAALLAAGPSVSPAQEAGMDHSAMGHDGAAMEAPSSKAFMAAMEGMRNGMSKEMTGDPDLDFLQGMIPHHEGAIAMAKAELEYGKDSQAKELAQRIVADQQAEIELMKRMIAERKGAAR